MSCHLKHLQHGNQHFLALLDNTTTLPVLFGSIYAMRKLAFLRFKTQKKELLSLKYFYVFWWKKNGETFDHSFRKARYNLSQAIGELDAFFYYLLDQQHKAGFDGVQLRPYNFSQSPGHYRHNCTEHIRSVTKFLDYMNHRYMTPRYQDVSMDTGKQRLLYTRMLRDVTRTFSRKTRNVTAEKQPYRSLTEEQIKRLDDMLLPSTPAFTDDISGVVYEATVNPVNPFSSSFLQFRNYLIHRLMFNYGLRVGEVLMLTTDSAGVSRPDSQGGYHYLLSVQNLPENVVDPRKHPFTLKNSYASRLIELDEEDWHYMTLFITTFRAPLFSSASEKTPPADNGFLFTSNRGQCLPLTYDAILKSYQKIERAFTSLWPGYRQGPFIQQMGRLTPHTGRHSWAFITLAFIYKKLAEEELRLKKQYGISGRMQGLIDTAAEQLRLLGGWSEYSRMPWRYARRFLARMANENNLARTKQFRSAPLPDHDITTLSRSEADYDPFI